LRSKNKKHPHRLRFDDLELMSSGAFAGGVNKPGNVRFAYAYCAINNKARSSCAANLNLRLCSFLFRCYGVPVNDTSAEETLTLRWTARLVRLFPTSGKFSLASISREALLASSLLLMCPCPSKRF